MIGPSREPLFRRRSGPPWSRRGLWGTVQDWSSRTAGFRDAVQAAICRSLRARAWLTEVAAAVDDPVHAAAGQSLPPVQAGSLLCKPWATHPCGCAEPSESASESAAVGLSAMHAATRPVLSRRLHAGTLPAALDWGSLACRCGDPESALPVGSAFRPVGRLIQICSAEGDPDARCIKPAVGGADAGADRSAAAPAVQTATCCASCGWNMNME